MAEEEAGIVPVPETPKARTAWATWPVVGGLAAVLVGLGGCVMTGHPYIADAFYFIGFILVLLKFLTWEDSKHETEQKTALLLGGGTVLLTAAFVGLCYLSYFVNKPSEPKSATPMTDPHPDSRVVARDGNPVIQPTPAPNQAQKQNGTERKLKGTKQKLEEPNQVVPEATQSLPAPTYQQLCSNGSPCTQGPNSPAIANNYNFGPTPPGILNFHQKELAPRGVTGQYEGSTEKGDTNKPGLEIGFSVDKSFPSPQFAVTCDNPCTATSAMTQQGNFEIYSGGSASPHLGYTDNPKVVLFALGDLRSLSPGVWVILRVRSANLTPLKSASVRPFIDR